MYTLYQTLLSVFPIKLMFQHYFELVLVLISLVFLRKLKQNQLGFIPVFLFSGFLIDLTFQNSTWHRLIKPIQCFQITIIGIGTYIYPALKKYKITPVLILLLSNTVVTIIMRVYSYQGQYNLFIYNLRYPLVALVHFYLFYSLLKPKAHFKIAFLLVTISSEIFFVFDYIRSGNILSNYVSSSIYYILLIAGSCLVITRILKENLQTRLLDNPLFWFYSALLIPSLIDLIIDGLHPYLVVRVNISGEMFTILERIEAIGFLFFDIAVFYAFCLCAKYESARLRIRLFKKKRKQSIHYDTVTVTPNS